MASRKGNNNNNRGGRKSGRGGRGSRAQEEFTWIVDPKTKEVIIIPFDSKTAEKKTVTMETGSSPKNRAIPSNRGKNGSAASSLEQIQSPKFVTAQLEQWTSSSSDSEEAIQFKSDSESDSDSQMSDEEMEELAMDLSAQVMMDMEFEVRRNSKMFEDSVQEEEDEEDDSVDDELYKEYMKRLISAEEPTDFNPAPFPRFFENAVVNFRITDEPDSPPATPQKKLGHTKRKSKPTPPKKTPPKQEAKSPTIAWVQGSSLSPKVEPENQDSASESEEEEEMIVVGLSSTSPSSPSIPFQKKQRFSVKDLLQLNQALRNFIQDRAILAMPFASLSKAQRVQLHKLGGAYGLKPQSYGSGKKGYTELIKTAHTELIPIEEATTFIEAMCDKKAKDDTEMKNGNNNNSESTRPKKNGKGRKASNPKKEEKYGKFKKNNASPSSQLEPTGQFVASHAKPIGESNIGMKMMKSMGWEGGGLGAAGQGIVDPVQAVLKKDKKGLGFSPPSKQ